MALARRQVPQLKLLVVGDGPDLAALKALVQREGLQDAVLFAGWTDGLSPVYAAIDALALPSRYEGVPLVMLQALYFKRPVIASAVDGMLDILPAHWLFPSGDAAAFAARLVQAVHVTQDAGTAAREAALLELHHQQVALKFSLPVFERAFMAAVVAAVQRQRRAAGSAS